MSEEVHKVLCWRLSLDNTPRLHRLVKVDSNQIRTLPEKNRRYTMGETADTLKIPKSTKVLVKMKNMSFILWKKTHELFGQPNITNVGR